MSGQNEHTDDIRNICRDARRIMNPAVHTNAIIQLTNLTKNRTGDARKFGIYAIAEIGKATRWVEQKALAFKK